MRHLALLLLAVTVVLGGCATFDPLEDTRIEAEVKAGLVAQKDANLTRLGVVSNDGAVYLTGTVESEEQRARAARVAKSVRGVRRVVNTVQVGTASR
jgi:hyperosmotically inducible protein